MNNENKANFTKNNVIKVDFTKNKNKRSNKSMIPGKILVINQYLFKKWFEENGSSWEVINAFEETHNLELSSYETFVEWAEEFFEKKMNAQYQTRIKRA